MATWATSWTPGPQSCRALDQDPGGPDTPCTRAPEDPYLAVPWITARKDPQFAEHWTPAQRDPRHGDMDHSCPTAPWTTARQDPRLNASYTLAWEIRPRRALDSGIGGLPLGYVLDSCTRGLLSPRTLDTYTRKPCPVSP